MIKPNIPASNEVHPGDRRRAHPALSFALRNPAVRIGDGIPHRLRVPVPLITPWLSSLWIGLVTPVDAGVARPLIESLAMPTVVSDPSGMRRFDIESVGCDEALRNAVAKDPDLVPA